MSTAEILFTLSNRDKWAKINYTKHSINSNNVSIAAIECTIEIGMLEVGAQGGLSFITRHAAEAETKKNVIFNNI